MADAQDLICATRLCRPDILVHDGLTQINADNPKPSQYSLLTVLQCSNCGRMVNTFWDEKRRREWREKNLQA